ncbi:hypothetical protein GCM10022295_27420 [Streptomyces osmaniensis]|uniref:Uncharacterized protein n=1 Tax=Streptomyces osmaniensis TaxID=593134 RepID=A0ABP6W1P9_9ACTN
MPDRAGRPAATGRAESAYVSAWLARVGAHPIEIGLSEKQLATPRVMEADSEGPGTRPKGPRNVY